MHTLPAAESANLHFVTPRLAIGGDISAHDDDLAVLQSSEICTLGITHIVSAEGEPDLRDFGACPEHKYVLNALGVCSQCEEDH